MINENDKQVIATLAAKFDVKSIVLFGSSAGRSSVGTDIDLGVSGISPKRYSRFYADPMWALSRPVDLVDLDKESIFTRLVRREGVVLYEQVA